MLSVLPLASGWPAGGQRGGKVIQPGRLGWLRRAPGGGQNKPNAAKGRFGLFFIFLRGVCTL